MLPQAGPLTSSAALPAVLAAQAGRHAPTRRAPEKHPLQRCPWRTHTTRFSPPQTHTVPEARACHRLAQARPQVYGTQHGPERWSSTRSTQGQQGSWGQVALPDRTPGAWPAASAPAWHQHTARLARAGPRQRPAASRDRCQQEAWQGARRAPLVLVPRHSPMPLLRGSKNTLNLHLKGAPGAHASPSRRPETSGAHAPPGISRCAHSWTCGWW